jgi:hypothetical protein
MYFSTIRYNSRQLQGRAWCSDRRSRLQLMPGQDCRCGIGHFSWALLVRRRAAPASAGAGVWTGAVRPRGRQRPLWRRTARPCPDLRGSVRPTVRPRSASRCPPVSVCGYIISNPPEPPTPVPSSKESTCPDRLQVEHEGPGEDRNDVTPRSGGRSPAQRRSRT